MKPCEVIAKLKIRRRTPSHTGTQLVPIMPLLVVQRSAHGVALDHQFNHCFYQKPSKVSPPPPPKAQPTRTTPTKTATATGHVQFTKIEEPLSAVDQQALDFTMSKFKASSAASTAATRHPLYRQFYGAGAGGGGGPDESPPYEKNHEEQGNCQRRIRLAIADSELSKQDHHHPLCQRLRSCSAKWKKSSHSASCPLRG